MKITIEKIIIEGEIPEIKGLFSSEELTKGLTQHVKIQQPKTDDSAPKLQPKPKPEAKQQETPVEQPAPKVEAAAPKVEAAAQKEITNEDIRAAMERVRNKLEYGTPAPGEDKGPNEEADTTIHRDLTALFKDTAKRLGADKPSTLPQEKRAEFIEAINTFELHDGAVVPF